MAAVFSYTLPDLLLTLLRATRPFECVTGSYRVDRRLPRTQTCNSMSGISTPLVCVRAKPVSAAVSRDTRA